MKQLIKFTWPKYSYMLLFRYTVADDISDRVEIIGPDSAALHTTVAYYLHIDYYVSKTCLFV